MSDNNSGNIVAGILIADELQRQAEAKRLDEQYRNQRINDGLRNQANQAKQETNTIKKQKIALTEAVDDLETDNILLRRENQFFRQLLAQPMNVIAQHNENFKKTYEEQMRFLADWMVSQKAFKELAIEFGFDKGYTPEQVIEIGKDKKLDVLEDKHDPSHRTNVGDDQFIVARKESLADEYKKDKVARKAKKS